MRGRGLCRRAQRFQLGYELVEKGTRIRLVEKVVVEKVGSLQALGQAGLGCFVRVFLVELVVKSARRSKILPR